MVSAILWMATLLGVAMALDSTNKGTLTLSNTGPRRSSPYTGPTTVSGGKLIVNANMTGTGAGRMSTPLSPATWPVLAGSGNHRRHHHDSQRRRSRRRFRWQPTPGTPLALPVL